MPSIQKAGKYLGVVTRKVITRSKNGYATLEADCELHEVLVPGKGYQVLPQPEHGKAFLMLQGQRGINEKQREALMGAFEWDGMSLKTLQNANCDGVQLKFSVSEDPNNKQYPFSIDWINAPSTDRALPTDELDKLDAEFRAQLSESVDNIPW